MARGLIGKAIRGAAAVAVPALMEQHRANILAEREERMREYREQETIDARKFQTSERVAGQEFRAEQADLTREDNATKAAAKRTQQLSDMDLKQQYAKELADYKATHGEGAKPTANQKDVAAMVKAGVFKTEAEAWKSVKGAKGSEIATVFKVLSAAQSDQFLEPDDPNYKDPRALYAEAKSIISSDAAATKPEPESKYIKGKIYVDAEGNQARWNGTDWEEL